MTRDFLYGIVEAAEPAEMDVRGLDGTSPVRVVASGDLGAVVSAHTTATDLQELPREILLKCLVAYQRVVEHVMQRQPVLPVKFGTQLESADEARDLVAQNRTTLGRAFTRMRGLVELEVAATWEIGRILREIGLEPEMVSAREAIERRGAPTPDDRVQLGRLAGERVESRRMAIRSRAADTLEPLASRTATHAILDEALVMNEAFLVAVTDVPEFERQVHHLDALFDGQIRFSIIGPLPPYSFSTVEVNRVTAQQREEARRALGLSNGQLDEHAIRDAYRRAAAAVRRQQPGAATAAELHGHRLRDASELLLELSRTDATNESPGSGERDQWITRIQTMGLDGISPASFGGGA